MSVPVLIQRLQVLLQHNHGAGGFDPPHLYCGLRPRHILTPAITQLKLVSADQTSLHEKLHLDPSTCVSLQFVSPSQGFGIVFAAQSPRKL